MSFTDLIKGRTQKYIKRIPKPGGGYRYIYREHHGGGVANKEHFDAGAAFKLTFKGQVGHFHITAVEGDKLKVKHDELHGDDHPGIEITRDELAQLLSTEHAAALKENAQAKRQQADKLKREKPGSLAAAAAEKRAKVAAAKVTEEPAPSFTKKEKKALDTLAEFRVNQGLTLKDFNEAELNTLLEKIDSALERRPPQENTQQLERAKSYVWTEREKKATANLRERKIRAAFGSPLNKEIIENGKNAREKTEALRAQLKRQARRFELKQQVDEKHLSPAKLDGNYTPADAQALALEHAEKQPYQALRVYEIAQHIEENKGKKDAPAPFVGIKDEHSILLSELVHDEPPTTSSSLTTAREREIEEAVRLLEYRDTTTESGKRTAESKRGQAQIIAALEQHIEEHYPQEDTSPFKEVRAKTRTAIEAQIDELKAHTRASQEHRERRAAALKALNAIARGEHLNATTESKSEPAPEPEPAQEQEPPETAEQVEQGIKDAIGQERPRQLKQIGEKITSVKPFDNIDPRSLFTHALRGLGSEARALVSAINTPEIHQRISDIYRAVYKKGARVYQAREQAYPLILEQVINAVESIDLNTFFEGNTEGLAKIKRRINTLKELKAKGAPAAKPAQEQEPRPANFETMPESSTDYTREGVALSSKAKGALNKALGEAMLKGDAAKMEELRARRDTEALFTGAPGVDTLLSEAIKGAKREETADGSEHSEASGELSTTEAEALDNAVESGHLIAHHNEGLTTYRASAERAAQTEGTTWRLAVRNGRYTLTLDDFTQGSTRLDPEQAPTEAEPAREPEKVDAVLSELEQLMKAHPHLANDPRLVGLLGSQADTAPKSEGAEAPLFITGIEGEERTQKARYRLMEAGDVIASHNPLSFMTREDYPEGIQERDYHQNKGEQLKVERNAAHLEPAYLLNTNPDATNGPPIITPEGVVLGGNSRAMSLQLAYGRGGEKGAKYKEQLTKQAAAFGFSPSDIEALKAPVLVRVYEPKEQSREHLAKLVRTMNETKTQGLDSRIEGRALASKISKRTLETIAKGLAKAPDKYSLNRYLTKPSTGLTEVIRSLQKDKVITPENTPIYLRDDGTLSAAGREMIANALVGYVVRDEKVLKAMDYQTFENISTALGKLAGAGLGPAVTSALESAITIYDQAIRSDEITARGSIESRLEGVAHILDKQELFGGGASAGDTDIEGHRRNVRENPLAGAFLQIFTMNKGSAQIEESLERFMELTKEKEQMDFFAAPPMEYEAAARKIVSELAEKHKVETRLYSDAEKERAESALL